jgi:hypothetical protein
MSSNLFGLSAASFYALGKKNNSTSPSGNYVTLDTVQTITANKIFANLNVQNILGIDIGVQGNIYLTGFIQFGDGSIQSTATPSTQSYVTVDTTQTITGAKTFSQSTYFNLLNAAVISTPSVNVTTITFGDGSTQTTATTNAQISTTTVQSGTYYPVFTMSGQGSNNTTPYTSGNLSFDNNNNRMTLPNLDVYGQLNVNSSDAYTRQMSCSYYNFYDGTNLSPAIVMGRVYATTGGFVFDLTDHPSSTFVFYANNGGTPTAPLEITPTSINAVSINCSGIISGNGSGLTNLNVVSPTFNTTTATTGTFFPVWTLSGNGATNVTPYTSFNISYGIDNNLLTIPNVHVYGVLDMTAASAATRSIYCSYYRFYTTTDGAGVQQGAMYSDNTGINFDLSAYPNKSFTFSTNDGVNVTAPLIITPDEIQADTHFHVPNQTSIRLGEFQQTSGANSSRILQQGEYMSIANNSTGGAINFSTTSTGNQFATQLSVSSALIALTADNNTAPTVALGNNTTTIATTAFVTNAVTNLSVSNVYVTTGGGSSNYILFSQNGINATGAIAGDSNLRFNTTTNTVSADYFQGSFSGTSDRAVYLSFGNAGQIPYQSAPNTTNFTTTGAIGQVLTSQGTGAPTWTTPTSSGTVFNGLAIAGNTAANQFYSVKLGNEINYNGTGQRNTHVGYQAGRNVSTGQDNVLIGAYAANSLTGGANNVIIGDYAGGSNLFNGQNNILIGMQANSYAIDTSNNIVIGNDGFHYDTKSNIIVIGDLTQTQYIQGQVNHKTQTLTNTIVANNAIYQYYLPDVLPSTVYLYQHSSSTGVKMYVVLPAMNMRYQGAEITLRAKGTYLPLPEICIRLVDNSGKLVYDTGNNYNMLASELQLNTNIYATISCDGEFWYLNERRSYGRTG